MRATKTITTAKQILFPNEPGLETVRFIEAGRNIAALVPAYERFGLIREMLLQRVYEKLGFGRVIIDAGANVGLFSLVASQHAEQVISLEPNPVNYQVLSLNLAVNGISNVKALQAALWTGTGEIGLQLPGWEAGRPITTRSYVTETDATFLVQSVTIDALVAEYGPIDLLKLDIEGAEHAVIPHTEALRDVDRIVAELHLNHPSDAEPIITALESQGFSVQMASSASLYQSSWLPQVFRNLRAVHGEWLVKLAVFAYLLAPVEQRQPGRDMPLLYATRR